MERFRDAVAIKDQASASTVEHLGSDGSAKQEKAVSSVHPKAIRPVGALHCTLGVMSLSKTQLEDAVTVLKALDVSALLHGSRKTVSQEQPTSSSKPDAEGKPEGRPASLERPISPPLTERSTAPPLVVDLKGLVSMHAPQKTSILYSAPTDASELLYPFCLSVQKFFAERGFLVPDDRDLKLHATVINTIYAKGKKRPPPKRDARQQSPDRDEAASGEQAGGEPEKLGPDDRSQGHGPNANAPLKIDATALLAYFEDFVWAEKVVLDRLAICEMGAKKTTDAEGKVIAEEYTEVACVKLPT